MSDNDIIIKHDQIGEGIHLATSNAETYFLNSKTMYEQKQYQSSIPLATISFEETRKALALIEFFANGKNITKKEWNKLTEHEYKLKHGGQVSRRAIESFSEEQHQNYYIELEKNGIGFDRMSKADLLKRTDSMISHEIKLQKLRETCFYGDWIIEKQNWKSLQSLLEEELDALAFYVLQMARVNRWGLHDVLVELGLNWIEYDLSLESKEIDEIKKHFEKKLNLGETTLNKFIV